MYINNSYSFLWLFSSAKRALMSQIFSLTAIRGNNSILTVMIEFCWRYFTSPYLKILKIVCRQEKNQQRSLLPLIRILSSAHYHSISAFSHLRFSIRILSSTLFFLHYIIRVFPSAIWSVVYRDLLLVSLGLVSIAKDCDCDSVALYEPPRWRITHIYDTTSKLLLQTKLFWPQCKGFDANKISFGNKMQQYVHLPWPKWFLHIVDYVQGTMCFLVVLLSDPLKLVRYFFFWFSTVNYFHLCLFRAATTVVWTVIKVTQYIKEP